MTHVAFIDGATFKSNPSDKIGCGILFNKQEYCISLNTDCKDLTSNLAEYYSLYFLLLMIRDQEIKNIIIHSDSRLLVNQMNNVWKIKNEGIIYQPLAIKSQSLLNDLKKNCQIQIKWIKREKNKVADHLSKQALTL